MKVAFKIMLIVPVILCVSCDGSDTSKIETAIVEQLEKYPESRLQDIYKNFYQDCFGTGHAISDTTMVLNYLQNELQNTQPTPSSPMIESIGWRHNFVRVNIDAVRQGKISAKKLAEAFIISASKINAKDTANWNNEWQTITQIIEERKLPVKNYEADKILIDSILQIKPKAAMHHSKAFNENYNPHYRVVEKSVFDETIAKFIK
ncbi:MAG: hypothetical protein LBG80_13435 [Bacteroidales bacterium]|jgi:hypothetical protein|nr:hypothetical protein [Bacteroidales bacterium]